MMPLFSYFSRIVMIAGKISKPKMVGCLHSVKVTAPSNSTPIFPHKYMHGSIWYSAEKASQSKGWMHEGIACYNKSFETATKNQNKRPRCMVRFKKQRNNLQTVPKQRSVNRKI
jgi:hypothetical protein